MAKVSVSKQIKKWYLSIESRQFEGLAENIKEILPVSNPKYNQQLDSLITRLTHSYMNYHDSKKGDVKMGLVVFELTCCFCDKFTESSDPPRLRSGIYHIARILREVKLYSEAQVLCEYIIPGTIFSPNATDVEYFTKLSIAWRQSTEVEMNSLSTEFISNTYNTVLEMVKFDFRLLKFADKTDNHSIILFGRFQRYIDQIVICDNGWTEIRIIKFIDDVIQHIKNLQSTSQLEIDALKIYDEIIDMMHSLSVKLVRANKMEEVWNFVNKCAKMFKTFVEINSETRELFRLQLDFYKTLLKPVVNFDEAMLEEISNYKCQFESKLNVFGQSNILKANSLGIDKILTPLFNYWLKCMITCETKFLNKIFFEIVELVNHAASLLATQTVNNCKCNLSTCRAKFNTYEQINIIQKCGIFACMIEKKDLSEELLNFCRDFMDEIVDSIYEYKKTKCGQYTNLWSTCGQVMYNLGLLASVDFLDRSEEFLSNLCCFIIREDGIKCKNNFLRNSNPLSQVLYKLSGVYFRGEKYREAMTVTAFNGLISYYNKDTKAFKMWANIKHQCKSSEDILKLTMIACLKADEAAIKELGVKIHMRDHDLVKLCTREIEGLQKAKVCLTVAIKASLKQLDALKRNSMEFVEAVQYLGYHLIYFRDDCPVKEYLKKAEYNLSLFDQDSSYNSSLRINLQFFEFMDQNNTTSKKIKEDIKSAKNILQRSKDQTLDETLIEPEEVVPVYRTINMKHDHQVALELEHVLINWKKIFAKDPKVIFNCWEPEITLDLIIIAGEMARLYLSQENEKRAWLLAYELASVLKNHAACLYVTARSISLRYINEIWIEKANKYANSLRKSENVDDKSAVGMFWTSLADFYFETGKVKEAVVLIDLVKTLDSVKLTVDVPVYLDYVDTIIRNYQFCSNSLSTEEYSEHLVHHVYTMVSVNQTLDIGGKKTYYGLNTLLDGVNNLSLVMNSFTSFREISAHLTLRLELAQSLGATLRVAECLKSLCYIDLSRWKLDDCEMKLQGIEQILDNEGFGLSMKSHCTELRDARAHSNSNSKSRRMDVDDPLRDVMDNNTSPILRKKVFALPEFMLHDKCECYRCLNIPYQYLIFSSTYIRAQIHALKKYSETALQHFDGALNVRRKLLAREKEKILKDCDASGKHYHWKKYYTTVDYVLLLLDFSKFIMYHESEPNEKDAMEIAFESIKICKENNLQTHPIFAAANELLFGYRLQRLNPSFKGFTVPDVADIDISDLVPENNPYPWRSCKTPSHSGDLPLKDIHKKKIPPLLPLKKVGLDFGDSDDEDSNSATKTKRQAFRKRLLIADEESSHSSEDMSTVSQPDLSARSESSKTGAIKKIPLVVVDETETISDSMKKVSISSSSTDDEKSERLASRSKARRGESSKTKTVEKKILSPDQAKDLADSLNKISSSLTSLRENSQSKRLSARNKAASSGGTSTSSKLKTVEKKTLSTDPTEDSGISTFAEDKSLQIKRSSAKNKAPDIESSQRRSKRLASRDVKAISKSSDSNCSSVDMFESDDSS